MKAGDGAWIALGLGIFTYEACAPEGELLSEAADRYMAAHPWVTRAVVGLVAAHLTNLLPPWLDPLHGVGVLAGR